MVYDIVLFQCFNIKVLSLNEYDTFVYLGILYMLICHVFVEQSVFTILFAYSILRAIFILKGELSLKI